MVCDNPSQTIPASLRAEWLREIHPSAHVVVVPDDLPDDDSSAWARRTIEVIGVKPDVVFTSEDYGEPYSQAMGCEHVQVDKARSTIPCSATQIRANPLAHLDFLEPCVRAHYIPRICIVGAESTGKTTLAQKLAEHYGCEWIAEYGREYSEKKIERERSSPAKQREIPRPVRRSGSEGESGDGGRYESLELGLLPQHGGDVANGDREGEYADPSKTLAPPPAPSSPPPPHVGEDLPPDYGAWTTDEFLHIAQTQLEREDGAARRATHPIICDTDAFATGIWHERYMGHASEDVSKIGRDHNNRIYLLLDRTVPFVQDGWRDGEHLREWMHKRFLEELPKLNRPFHLLSGDYDARYENAIRIIDRTAYGGSGDRD